MPTISHQDLSQHKTESSLWIAIENKVYDVTNFMSKHPGGKEILLRRGERRPNSFDTSFSGSVMPCRKVL